MVILVTGGVKSGKSSFALDLSRRYKKKAFIATGVPFDEEMRNRINRHKSERKGFDTFEEPVEVDKVIEGLNGKYEFAILDCITTYLGNLYYYKKDIENYLEKFLKSIKKVDYTLVCVTNEVGWGIIPENKQVREYVERLGLLNKDIAKIAQKVYLMVSGIGVELK
ncbi:MULTISPECIES: bifunctional adenosylcobinamide kinase/adenosylcobinamide-phosphate guanylyltransferase [unclassified Thermosipho (in: thermotogales)]|uniref:bifunctional adenosylcobinamide kinase/adenosylcobinamide-phosphate guanylyltransferase n=1 Tax=unclassified Thermosipho (in: thermotogales) TaxID=2676525 RepID=UPI000986F07E|nr:MULTISPECIES: bifunctional adenosylcobinamide kinase/adenosylcobinamide-phosphate guanylyltransferase [unclassified Thermosipho (in: thermotogales)]MBT1247658.1 adenosylcobinamide kinase/adenosylcobinamide phosphate guanyltransferase [Thermosipho sp. 1244]OOC43491.1 cobalamin biosynthesis protein [Thermosipho sp. 1074]OOC46757.1 cobalamin biosynthesis protein [Thermosipho sp. 1223]